MRCAFSTYHEYRVSYGLMGLAGIITGLVDGLVEDWIVKAFIWCFVLVLTSAIIAYEFIVMEAPERAMLQAMLFVILSLCGFISAHHFTWLGVSIMVGRKIVNPLWLAPNIYADIEVYNIALAAALAIYIAYMIYINLCTYD